MRSSFLNCVCPLEAPETGLRFARLRGSIRNFLQIARNNLKFMEQLTFFFAMRGTIGQTMAF